MFQRLRPEIPEDLSAVTKAGFQSTMLRGAIHIDGRDHPVHRVKTIVNIEGLETARYFALGNDKDWVGFAGETFDTFLELCHQFHNVEEVSECLSITAIVGAAFEWFHKMYLQPLESLPKSFSFTTGILAACEPEITSMEVWIPVMGIECITSFRLGHVQFKNVSSNDFENWLSSWGNRWPTQEHPHRDSVDQFFYKIAANLRSGNFPVAIVWLRAEPIRAVELALDEVERTLGMLRFFSRVNFYPLAVSYCAIEGNLPEGRSRYFLLKDRAFISGGYASAELINRPLEKLDTAKISEMRESGLDILDRILRLEHNQRTPYERLLIRAMETYARANLSRDVRDKLLYIVIALESMLVQGREGALRKKVAERLAFMLGQSLAERLEIIEIYYQAYEARSDAVHRGQMPKDLELLKDFMNLSWHAFNYLIHSCNLYNSQSDLIEKIDDIKFT